MVAIICSRIHRSCFIKLANSWLERARGIVSRMSNILLARDSAWLVDLSDSGQFLRMLIERDREKLEKLKE